MRKYNIIFIFLLFAYTMQARTFYVSNLGSDNYSPLQAQNSSTPWASIDKLNTTIWLPGDSILFRKGDIFRGQFLIKQSGTITQPIYIGAYGTGQMPIISGAVEVRGWQEYRPSIYIAPNTTNIRYLYANNKLWNNARFPNSGFVTTDQSTSGVLNKVKDSKLNQPTNYWQNARFRGRTKDWAFENKIVAASTSGELTLSSNLAYPMSSGYGYYLENVFTELDSIGEWFHNPTQQQTYLYATSPPELVEGSAYQSGIRISKANYLTIENLQFEKQISSGIRIDTARFCIIRNNLIQKIDLNGIQIVGGANHQLHNNTIQDIYGRGLIGGSFSLPSDSLSIIGNTFRRIGLIPAYGSSGVDGVTGILSFGSNCIIRQNILDSIGYNGIRFYRNDNIIEKNVIKNAVMMLNDGAGIYCWGTVTYNNIIKNNLISNCIGNFTMSEGTLKIGTGIYLDDESSNIKLIDNTLYNNYHGIFVHNSHKDTIVGNIVVGNTKNAMYLWKDAIVPQEIRNLSIKTNVFIGFGYPAYAAVYGVAFGNSTLNDLGAINNNYLFSAASTTPITWNNFTENGTGVLSEWQNAYGHDMESKDSPIELPHNDPNMPEIIKLFTNETDQPTTTTLFANYVDLDGNPITYTELTLSPYSSKVLLRNDFGRMGTQKVKTYPNPIDDSLTFTIELPKGLDFYKVEVVDASGRIIYTEKPAFKHTNTISLMKPVAVGTYIVKITDPVSKKIYTSKIIKK